MSVANLKDLQPWRTITIERTEGIPEGVTSVREDYVVWFTSNAIFKLERAIGLGFEQFLAEFQASATGFSNLHALLYAGLEGARMKMFPRKPEWTMEGVGDLIDACGGARRFWVDNADLASVLGQAVGASLPRPKKVDPPPAAELAAGGATEEGPATTAADPSSPATVASTGVA